MFKWNVRHSIQQLCIYMPILLRASRHLKSTLVAGSILTRRPHNCFAIPNSKKATWNEEQPTGKTSPTTTNTISNFLLGAVVSYKSWPTSQSHQIEFWIHIPYIAETKFSGYRPLAVGSQNRSPASSNNAEKCQVSSGRKSSQLTMAVVEEEGREAMHPRNLSDVAQRSLRIQGRWF